MLIPMPPARRSTSITVAVGVRGKARGAGGPEVPVGSGSSVHAVAARRRIAASVIRLPAPSRSRGRGAWGRMGFRLGGRKVRPAARCRWAIHNSPSHADFTRISRHAGCWFVRFPPPSVTVNTCETGPRRMRRGPVGYVVDDRGRAFAALRGGATARNSTTPSRATARTLATGSWCSPRHSGPRCGTAGHPRRCSTASSSPPR